MSWKEWMNKTGLVTFEISKNTEADPKKPLKGQMMKGEDVATPVVKNYATVTIPTFTPGGTISPEIKQHLLDVIKENNFDGYDYCEFAAQLDITKTFPIPEEQKYKAAFSAVSAQAQLAKKPFDKTILVSTTAQYKSIIEKEVNGFEAEFQKTYKVEVEDKKTEVELKTKKLQELAEEMNKLNLEIQNTNNEISQSDAQLKVNKELFLATSNSVLSDIDAEIEKINQYIQ